MKDKFNFIYETVKDSLVKLQNNEISIEHAKAVSALAKQANNVLCTQLETAKFIANEGIDSKTIDSSLDRAGL